MAGKIGDAAKPVKGRSEAETSTTEAATEVIQEAVRGQGKVPRQSHIQPDKEEVTLKNPNREQTITCISIPGPLLERARIQGGFRSELFPSA